MSSTWSMAPGAPRIPKRILAPSKAGPAAVEQARRRSRFPRTISPLVPMSMSRVSSSRRSKAAETMHPTVSAPTKPAILGSTRTAARGQAVSQSAFGSSMASRTEGI